MQKWVKRFGATAAVGLAAAMIPAAAGASTSPGWRVTQTFGAAANYPNLEGVAAVSSNDAWISGTTIQSLLVERYTNGKWQQLADPAGFSGGNITVDDQLIAASGLTNAWTFPTVGTNAGTTQYALEWNGHAWTKFKLSGFQLLGAATFSSSDVWVFGAKNPPANSLGYGAPDVTRYTGHKWEQAATPPGVVLKVSTLNANDIWGFGPTTKTASGSGTSWSYLAMHWNGKKWLSFGIPKEAPVDGHPWVVSGIDALSDKNVWVTEGVSVSEGGGQLTPGLALLHWNGSKWQTAAKTSGVLNAGGLAYDGHGGFWISATASSGASGDLLHYSGGKLTQQAAPTIKGYTGFAGPLAYIPGTESVWGLGVLSPASTSAMDEDAIAKDGP
jgi:hypothetical protein